MPIAAAGLVPSQASKLKVVTSTSDLAALVAEVGGDRIEVESLARGYQDPHSVETKPSFLLKLRQADLFIVVGLQLENGWPGQRLRMPSFLAQSGNPRIQVGAPGYLDASQFAEILETPTTAVTHAMGIHPFGNPHYSLDPENGRRIARGIERKLDEMRPGDAAYFEQRFQSFSERLRQAEQRWDEQMKPLRGRKLVTYHRSWANFLKRFGLESVGEIEPRPGIPPGRAQIAELTQLMKRENVKVILVEPYFDPKTPNAIARETGAQVVVLLPSVGGQKEVKGYFKLFDYDVALLIKAFQAAD
jgi:zinc/manganese transport system substrate-binding protein